MKEAMTEQRFDQDVPDGELIRQYLEGSRESFEMLYHRYRNSLYAYLNNLLEQKKSAVDDVFQQTWLKAIDHLSAYKDNNMFLAWLMRIAHNAAMDHCRKDKKNGQYEISLFPEDKLQDGEGNGVQADISDERYAPGRSMEQQEVAVIVKKAVNSLPPELREVFLLRTEKIPFREIARIQKCSINTVLARMQYALKNLRKILGGVKDDF